MGATATLETERRPRQPPAPKAVQLRQAGGQLALAMQPAELCAVFGVADPGVATHLLGQLLGVLHTDATAPVDAALINQALALVHGIGPADATEAMIAVMAVAAQHAAM